MEKNSEVSKPVESLETELEELPPGFRFHPTDEELITHYLTPKVFDNSFSARAIGEVDLKKVEPWDLPWRAKMGEEEWYFFCVRDKKYPTGSRTNRATEAGYWKATGKDKEIFWFNKLVGMKKTLVFYTGRAPKGEKTNWVMHEYRLEGKNSVSTQSSKAPKNEWVISRIFKKTSGGKKVHISGLLRTNNDCSETSYLPSLMEFSSEDQVSKRIIHTDSSSQKFCLSSSLENKKPLENLSINDLAASSSSRDSDFSQHPLPFPNVSSQDFLFSNQFIPYLENLQHLDSNSSILQEESILRLLLEQNNDGQGNSTRQNVKVELSGDTTDMSSTTTLSNQVGNLRAYGYGDQELPVIISGPVDLDCLWNC